MVGAPKKSPIDTLLKKNLMMASSSSDAPPRPVINIKPQTEFLMTRTKSFCDDETAYLKSWEVDTDREISLIERSMDIDGWMENDDSMENDDWMENEIRISRQREEDLLKKEKLLERLRRLGLAPHKYSAKKTSRSSNKRKSQIPRRVHISYDNCFVQPRVFECDFCPKLFFHQTLFRRHTIKHLTHRKCGRCNKLFKCSNTLRKHRSHCKKLKY